jgi:hypothetical protein
MYPDHHLLSTHTSSMFAEAGSLIEQRHVNPDGAQWSIICRYDDHGRMSQKLRQFAKGTEVFSFQYDELGRLESVVSRSGTGAERLCESYIYDQGGRKSVTVYPDPALRGEISADIEAAFEVSFEASSIMTTFDDRDQPVSRVFYDQNGNVDRRILMRYDAVGRLLEEGECEANGGIREDLRYAHRYDPEGRLIEKTMYHHAVGTHRIMFVYDDEGEVSEERHQRRGGIVIQGGDQNWTTRYRYQYDDHGNWTERVANTLLPTGDAAGSVIERRRIEYY